MATTIVVHGAWMAGWIWDPTVQELRRRGIGAQTITLAGLEPDRSPNDRAVIRLGDHVRQLCAHVTASPGPVILVSHSYSGMVTASAADRLGERVLGLIHLGAFLPAAGRAMIDDWGGSDEDRRREEAEIEAAGNLWPAPTREMLEGQTDLSTGDRDRLASRFTPHPGRTVLDPAELGAPVADQPSTYVTLAPQGDRDDAWSEAPATARDASGWRRRHISSGHWPMLSAFGPTLDLLVSEIRHYQSEE